MIKEQKNIIILGCQRSGKTTLANLLKNSGIYTLFSVDSLIYSFEKNIPQAGINTKTEIREKSPILTKFISDYFVGFSRCYPNHNYLIESCQLLPKDIINDKVLNKCIIICLGYPNATVEEIYKKIRENDKNNFKNSYTTIKTEEELKKLIEIWILYSKRLKEDCEKFSIPFYETNVNREETLKHIVNSIINR